MIAHRISSVIEWRKTLWKFQGSITIKKEVEFPGVQSVVFKKNSYGISIGQSFWSWNFQGISHNIPEFPGVKSCFLMDFWEVKVQKSIPKPSYSQPPFHPPHPSPVQIFSGIRIAQLKLTYGENGFIFLIEWFLQFQSRETLGYSRTEKNPNTRVADILFWT